MLWVHDQNSTDNSTAIFTAEQPLHSTEASALTLQQGAGKGRLQDSWPRPFKETFHVHQWWQDFRSSKYCLETGCASSILWIVVSNRLVTCLFGVRVGFFPSFLCKLKFLHLDHWAFSLFLYLPCLAKCGVGTTSCVVLSCWLVSSHHTGWVQIVCSGIKKIKTNFCTIFLNFFPPSFREHERENEHCNLLP